MSHLNKIVRRVLAEAETKGTEPEEPSYWDEAGEEVGRWGDAAAELGSDVAGAAGAIAQATLNMFVGQAHAPYDEENVRWAESNRSTIPKLVLSVMGELLPHVALTKFRISAKLMDAIGLPAREITAGKYGEDVAKDIYTGSVLHDILETTSLIPGGIVASMLLDSFVYAAEGDRKSAIATIALAAVFNSQGAAVAVAGKTAEIKAAKYTELTSRLAGVKQVTVVRGQEAAAKIAEDLGYRMERAGVKGAQRLGKEAGWAIRTNRLETAPALNSARVASAERSASELMAKGQGGETALKRAKRKWGEVSVEKPKIINTGREDVRANDEYVRQRSFFANTSDESRYTGTEVEKAAMRRAQTTMQGAQFVTQAKRLYRNLGVNVNIKPIAGSMQTVFAETGLSRYTSALSGRLGGPKIARVALTTNEEAAPILRELGVSERGMSSASTTIVPVSNAAGVDTLPTAWMISHAIFDGGEGNLLLQSMPKTKAIVNEVEGVFEQLRAVVHKREKAQGYGRHGSSIDRFGRVKYGVPSSYDAAISREKADIRSRAVVARAATDPSQALGLTVNSTWGANSREIVKGELEGVASGKMKHGDISKEKIAPPIGQRIAGKGVGSLRDVGDLGGLQAASKKTQALVTTAARYVDRPEIDSIAEILAAALTKQEGYVPDFSHILKDYPYRAEIEEAAKKIQQITADMPEAFAADTKGKVVWVAVN